MGEMLRSWVVEEEQLLPNVDGREKHESGKSIFSIVSLSLTRHRRRRSRCSFICGAGEFPRVGVGSKGNRYYHEEKVRQIWILVLRLLTHSPSETYSIFVCVRVHMLRQRENLRVTDRHIVTFWGKRRKRHAISFNTGHNKRIDTKAFGSGSGSTISTKDGNQFRS